ncbi:GtrA-like protein precursor [Sphingobium herbicidovorans NBRC 16415]|jgi:putative flippase GtrA|uniref:GtrA-like protein n=1 Tax=Sphingobium herbicidovorans (strain ATCC 700291 / DSM 11019 / CCUG 56400 / KCTC 2939 / LMG 18315 / NBRC 16415 / MH) TaxID=1219045 RepID=A0A086P4Y5_SPHHM|nr:GtrA family protein [Sphingobium herbicidovorans]KFG88453.1 GtrA-like protein precursor [Sphingobium herbicidovorans NBRC 16415]
MASFRIGSLAGAITARFTFIRYLLASLCALSGDMLLFLALLRMDVPPAAAAAVGYIGGLLLHWMISVRFVFTSTRRPTHGQRLGFAVSAAVGLGITTGLVSALGVAGLAPALAKLLAIPVSFLTVYAIRKYGVFAVA